MQSFDRELCSNQEPEPQHWHTAVLLTYKCMLTTDSGQISPSDKVTTSKPVPCILLAMQEQVRAGESR